MNRWDYHKAIGLAVRRRRQLMSWPQVRFAEHIGRDQAFVCRIEKMGQAMSIETLLRVADGLNTTPAAILRDAEEIVLAAKMSRGRLKRKEGDE